jgi:hypothetical protein
MNVQTETYVLEGLYMPASLVSGIVIRLTCRALNDGSIPNELWQHSAPEVQFNDAICHWRMRMLPE